MNQLKFLMVVFLSRVFITKHADFSGGIRVYIKFEMHRYCLRLANRPQQECVYVSVHAGPRKYSHHTQHSR